MGAAMAEQSPVFESALTARDRLRGHPLHQRHDRSAEGRRAQSHSNLVLNALESNRMLGAAPTGERHLVTLPLFHSFGSTRADERRVRERLDARAACPASTPTPWWSCSRSEDITFFAGVPTMYWGLLGALEGDVDVDRIAANMRIAVAGGASLPVEILKEFKARFHVDIFEGYGLSETSPGGDVQPAGPSPAKPGSIGYPIWGVEVKLIDEEWNDGRRRSGRGRRDRDPRPQHHEGLLQPARRHRRGDERRLVPLRRPRPPRRGRLLLHRRPGEGHDHPRRVQRLPARDRGGPA